VWRTATQSRSREASERRRRRRRRRNKKRSKKRDSFVKETIVVMQRCVEFL
jgi:hypothetical protein